MQRRLFNFSLNHSEKRDLHAGALARGLLFCLQFLDGLENGDGCLDSNLLDELEWISKSHYPFDFMWKAVLEEFTQRLDLTSP